MATLTKSLPAISALFLLLANLFLSVSPSPDPPVPAGSTVIPSAFAERAQCSATLLHVLHFALGSKHAGRSQNAQFHHDGGSSFDQSVIKNNVLFTG